MKLNKREEKVYDAMVLARWRQGVYNFSVEQIEHFIWGSSEKPKTSATIAKRLMASICAKTQASEWVVFRTSRLGRGSPAKYEMRRRGLFDEP